ncbi:hypothetical protein CERSUDRAFT_120586 [Gelatoporia subvermispora B]|uniref:Uncharacterized protein n=1 Tax=Ceriporiopsis subvermispora (strain B) TaxID=914234 RepID=M2RSX8_CERS8|nr:hypothetical protein CERSUDRAFT_120586 [Gelatoporia subvermispora B]
MHLAMLRIAILLIFLQFTALCTFAFPYNVTIDDTNGDPLTQRNVSYSPLGAWYSHQDCNPCPDPCGNVCPIGSFNDPMDLSQVVDATWHGSAFDSTATTSLNATVTFRGTAIYAYCVLNAGLFDSDMIFYLDGEQVGAYTYNEVASSGTPPYQYSVPVFQMESLPDDNHTFTLANGKSSAGNGLESVIFLDSFLYTTDLEEAPVPESTPSSSTIPIAAQGTAAKSRDAIIALATVAVILFIAIISGVVLYFRRLRFHGIERIVRGSDKSFSFDEDCPLSTESVASNYAPEQGIESQLRSPNLTSVTAANQPPGGAAQLVEPAVMSVTSGTPAFTSIPSSMDIQAGRAPIPPPGIPILDGPPPSPGLLRRMYAASSATEGGGSHYDESARGVFEGRQAVAGAPGPNLKSDKVVQEESSGRLGSPPPRYLERIGSVFARSDSSP